jgi:hypothetical protein
MKTTNCNQKTPFQSAYNSLLRISIVHLPTRFLLLLGRRVLVIPNIPDNNERDNDGKEQYLVEIFLGIGQNDRQEPLRQKTRPKNLARKVHGKKMNEAIDNSRTLSFEFVASVTNQIDQIPRTLTRTPRNRTSPRFATGNGSSFSVRGLKTPKPGRRPRGDRNRDGDLDVTSILCPLLLKYVFGRFIVS